MNGIEETYINSMIQTVLHANDALLDCSIKDAIGPNKAIGKGDTLGLDAIPEFIIKDKILKFDPDSVVITEERGRDSVYNKEKDAFHGFRTLFITDPMDRSSQLKKYLLSEEDKTKKVADVIFSNNAVDNWENDNDHPATITGAFAAVTCIRQRIPICSVLLNYITQDLILACDHGVLCFSLQKRLSTEEISSININTISSEGKLITFSSAGADFKHKYVAYLGKELYIKNRNSMGFLGSPEDMDLYLHYGLPGGPSRIFYLSDLQPENDGVGYIISNGEKITEWIHWLPVVRFGSREKRGISDALDLYEIRLDQPWTNSGILMATSPIYSIVRGSGTMKLDVDFLLKMPNPSHYRSTLIVLPKTNMWLRTKLENELQRKLRF